MSETAGSVALEVEGLRSGYHGVTVLKGLDFTVGNEIFTVLGANGAGKTTLLRTVMGLLRPWKGAVTFEGKDITRASPHSRASNGMALVPEGRQLFTDMSVYENLEMGSITGRARPHLQRNLEKVYALFPRIKERRNQKAGTLSGGEQQMLAVARGLMAEPEILMFDELSLGLSPVLVLTLFETLGALKAEGLTMLLVEQNVHMALAVSDYAYVLSEGKIWMEGEARSLAKNEEVRKAYLGI
jgi:branched-chain amino acid transport system ATP-binding protein